MVTRIIFGGLVILTGIQRLMEMRISARNERRLRELGGIEHAHWQIQAMKVIHGAWLVSSLGEVFARKRPFRPGFAAVGMLLFSAGQALRIAAIRTLGWRWTVRIITVPGAARVKKGIYGKLRHPNYLGVILEILGLPLIHTAYQTALLFSLINGLLLFFRIRAEEAALHQSAQPAEPIL